MGAGRRVRATVCGFAAIAWVLGALVRDAVTGRLRAELSANSRQPPRLAHRRGVEAIASRGARGVDLGLERIVSPGIWLNRAAGVASIEHLVDQLLVEVALTERVLVVGFGGHGLRPCVL